MKSRVLIHLPTELATRLRQTIPARNRSKFVQQLLEQFLPDADEAMYQAALKAQNFDNAHPDELVDLSASVMDGLDPDESFDLIRLKALFSG